VQHLEYVPFGETFIDERNGNWSTPYLFNAKEKDEETGLHYYTHRYYDSRTCVWLSSDPLREIFPNVSSYIYCHDNPVNRIDPDGRKDVVFNNDGTYKNTINDNFWHNLWYGTRGIINDKNGNIRATFRFNNSDDANRFQLKQGEKGYLRGINENFLSKNLDKLTNQGIKQAEN
jgi:RHS repeat-associated protein